jgi:hypothetical protein
MNQRMKSAVLTGSFLLTANMTGENSLLKLYDSQLLDEV